MLADFFLYRGSFLRFYIVCMFLVAIDGETGVGVRTLMCLVGYGNGKTVNTVGEEK